LNQDYLRARVEAITGQPTASISLEKLAGDASARHFYRLHYGEGQSLILMQFYPPQPQAQTELVQVWRYFSRWGLGVPYLYHHDLAQGLLFFEDAGHTTLEQVVKSHPPSVYYSYYEQAIELLLKIQQAGMQDQDPQCPAFSRAFDVAKLAEELNFFLKYMLEEQRNLKIPAPDKVKLQGHFRSLAEQLASEPRYLTHRDYHSRNLLVSDKGLMLVDFQDARLGPGEYDLASLLRDSYVRLSEAEVESLLDYFVRRKQKVEKIILDKGHFKKVFDYTCLQRNLKAVGTFAYLACIKGATRYLEYIPQTLDYVRQNLEKHPELADFRHLLGKYLPEVG